MALCIRITSAAMALLCAAGAWGQQGSPSTSPSNNSAPIVQPGAPGQNSRILSAAAAAIAPRAPSAADIGFMQGMIMHHSQAVEMTALLRSRGRSRDLQSFGQRITISQSDEIQFMKQWLSDRGQPEFAPHDMQGMDMKSMAGMNMMPGMLTPQQMKALARASGRAFDHLFLTGMIQHHTGALTMVQDLFNTAGAGQDAVLYDFATDVDNTQRAEIDIMRGMLLKEKK